MVSVDYDLGSMHAISIVSVVFAALATGLWPTLLKRGLLPPLHASGRYDTYDIPSDDAFSASYPLLIMQYFTIGMALSSWAILPIYNIPYVFTLWGVFGGFMLWGAVYMSAQAIRVLGIAVSGTISITTAMCVMWFWDSVVFRTHDSGYIILLMCVVFEAAGVRYTVSAWQLQQRQMHAEEKDRMEQQYPPPPKTYDVYGEVEDTPLLVYLGKAPSKSKIHQLEAPLLRASSTTSEIDIKKKGRESGRQSSFESFGEMNPQVLPEREAGAKRIEVLDEEARLAPLEVPGVICCVGCGLVAGSIFVPMSLANVPTSIVFLPSMAFGMFVAGIIAVIYSVTFHKVNFGPDLQLRSAFLPGLGAGCLWTVAAFCAVYSIDFISYAACVIVLTSAFFINGFCGIVWFQELSGKALQRYVLAASLLLGTALFLFCESSGLLPFFSVGHGSNLPKQNHILEFSYSYAPSEGPRIVGGRPPEMDIIMDDNEAALPESSYSYLYTVRETNIQS